MHSFLDVLDAGVTYDTYSDEYYWAIQGGQGSIYTSNSTLLSNARRLIDFRDNPFQLKFDWVARRLFWVEDGDTVSCNNTIVH